MEVEVRYEQLKEEIRKRYDSSRFDETDDLSS